MSVEFVKRKFGTTLTELMICKSSKKDHLEVWLSRKDGLYTAKTDVSYDYITSLKREIINNTIDYKNTVNLGCGPLKLVAYETKNTEFFRCNINDDITTGHFVITRKEMLEILEEVKHVIAVLDSKG